MLMIECTDESIIRPEFDYIQHFLLFHKYLYYEKGKSMLEDQHFDNCEKYSYTLAKNLGYRADKGIGPEEREKHHVHWMVGFNYNSPYWAKTKEKYKL